MGQYGWFVTGDGTHSAVYGWIDPFGGPMGPGGFDTSSFGGQFMGPGGLLVIHLEVLWVFLVLVVIIMLRMKRQWKNKTT